MKLIIISAVALIIILYFVFKSDKKSNVQPANSDPNNPTGPPSSPPGGPGGGPGSPGSPGGGPGGSPDGPGGSPGGGPGGSPDGPVKPVNYPCKTYNYTDKFSPDPNSSNYPCYYSESQSDNNNYWLNPKYNSSPGYRFNNPFKTPDLCKTGMSSCSQLNDTTNPKYKNNVNCFASGFKNLTDQQKQIFYTTCRYGNIENIPSCNGICKDISIAIGAPPQDAPQDINPSDNFVL
jgi:hypothetical protein